MEQKISPIKAKPLRQAGQSLQEQINKIIDDDLMEYAYFTMAFFGLMVYEWARFFKDSPPHPIISTVIFLTALVITLYKFIKNKRILKALKQGRDGEKVVGEYLEKLREDGCIVFHDIVGDKFNLDHVVLSTKGIFVIETKTYSKPKGTDPKIHYDGTHLNIDSIGNKDDVLIQVEAESNWLKEILKESTGKDFNIKPVVLFPGWFIESENKFKTWVLNPKAFPAFIQNQKEILNDTDVQLTAYHLSRYIRTL